MTSLVLVGIILGCVSISGLICSLVLGMRLLRFKSVFGTLYVSSVFLYLLAMILNTLIYWPDDLIVKQNLAKASQVLSNFGTFFIFSAMLNRYREFMPAITFLDSYKRLIRYLLKLPYVLWIIGVIFFIRSLMEIFQAFLPREIQIGVSNSNVTFVVYAGLLDICMSIHLIYMVHSGKVYSPDTGRLKRYLIMVLTGNFVMIIIGMVFYIFVPDVDPAIRVIHPFGIMSASTIGIYITLTSLFLMLFRNYTLSRRRAASQSANIP